MIVPLVLVDMAAAFPGARVAGMGGADIAGPADASGIHGNPAALALVGSSSYAAGWIDDVDAGPHASAALPIGDLGIGAIGFVDRESGDDLAVGWGRMVIERSQGGHLALGCSGRWRAGPGGSTFTAVGAIHANLLPFVSVAAVVPLLWSRSEEVPPAVRIGAAIRLGEEFEWVADVDRSGRAHVGAELRPGDSGLRLRVGRDERNPTLGLGWATGGFRFDAAATIAADDRLGLSGSLAWAPSGEVSW